MKFTRKDDTVTLEMSVADYESLLFHLGYNNGAVYTLADKRLFWDAIDFLNRLNEENQDFTPYEIPAEYATIKRS